MNDIKNLQIRNKAGKMKIPDISKSAHSQSNLSIGADIKRIKSSVPQRDMIDVLSPDSRENSFILQYQKQLLPRSSFSVQPKIEKPIPQTVVIHRIAEERMRNPDRITLDRHNMTSCPILENEDNLRLLNYQYNSITQIEHLERLRKLILLDLYDNRIEKISGLDSLKSLRVLMLGRNRISKIEGLDSLSRLDVLDLHANNVQRIENLNHLSELRVLNLAGNKIQNMDNVHGLVSLTEINARRNCIERVCNVTSYNCPNLQRIYLSFNQISKITDMSCLSDLGSLAELSLDNNPICRHSHTRACLVYTLPQLQQLDAKTITEDERYRSKQIVSRLDSGTKTNNGMSRYLSSNGKVQSIDIQNPSGHRFGTTKERRQSNVNNSRRMTDNWGHTGSISPRLSIKCFGGSNKTECSSNPLYVTDTSNNNLNISDSDHDVAARSTRMNVNTHDLSTSKEFHSIQTTLVRHGQIFQPVAQSSSQKLVTLRPSSASSTTSKADLSKSFISSECSDLPVNTVINNDTSQSETKSSDDPFLDIVVDTDQIVFYSLTGLRKFDDKDFWITKSGLSTTVTTLIFHDVDFIHIGKFFIHIKARFPVIKNMKFNSCNLFSLTQINSLANLKRLEELTINNIENPIASFVLIRYYVAFRLAHLGLRRFNDVEITEGEFLSGRRYFLPLASIGPGPMLQLHLVGLLTEPKRRELLQSFSDSTISSNLNNFSNQQPSSLSIDVVGKSGLLSGESSSESPNIGDVTLSSLSVASIIKSVDKKCDFENSFHNYWIGFLCQMILHRLESSGVNRHDYMRQQFDATLTKSKVTKLTSAPNSRK